LPRAWKLLEKRDCEEERRREIFTPNILRKPFLIVAPSFFEVRRVVAAPSPPGGARALTTRAYYLTHGLV
jgi:hypothetical protein